MKETKKESKVEFNVIRTLNVLEKDEILNNVFRKKNTMEYSLLRSIEKQGLTNNETKTLLKELFEELIIDNKNLLEIYNEGIIENVVEVAKKLPRRYGKDKIEADIEKQGGKPTELQLAMLAVNKLKNIYVNLTARGIKDMVGGTKLLSESDCRDIVAVVSTVEKKLKPILKRKK